MKRITFPVITIITLCLTVTVASANLTGTEHAALGINMPEPMTLILLTIGTAAAIPKRK